MLTACAAGVIALAGCGGGNEAADAGETGGEAIASGGALTAGQWDSTLTLEKVEFDEPDPETMEFFQSAIGQTNSSSTCLTAEEVSKPNADFFQGENSGYTYDNLTMSDGKIDSELTCIDGGTTMKVTMTGTYSEDSYEIQSTAKGELMPETQGELAMKASGKRVGDCTGEESKAAEG